MSDYKVDAKDVMKLRAETDAPVNECKQALTEAAGDMARAKEILREKGQASVGKKAGRATGAGREALLGRLSATLPAAGTPRAPAGPPRTVLHVATQLISDANTDLGQFAAESVAKFRENAQVGKTYRAEGGTIATYVHHDGSKGAIVIGEGNAEALRQVAIQVVAFPDTQVVTKDQLSQDFLDKELEVELKRAMEEGKPENIARNIAQGRVNKETVKRVVLTEQGFYKDATQSVGQFLKDSGGTTVREFALLAVGVGE